MDAEPVLLAAGELEAEFVPALGMVGCSLRHRGEELLGQRGGLEAYAERGSSFGIPLLHPWANRLDGLSYRAAGREVQLDTECSPLRLDEHGLPIHGLLAAAPGWAVSEASDHRLAARFDFEGEELLAAFPYPHELKVVAELDDSGLEVATTMRAGARVDVPVAFGWHPYLTLPGVPREQWHVEMPVAERAMLDSRGIPTGEVDPVDYEPGPLGALVLDDLFPSVPPPARFVLAGGGRRIETIFLERYPVAQVYAPKGQDFICFEPMTAPTNALVTGTQLPILGAGEELTARFRIDVSATG